MVYDGHCRLCTGGVRFIAERSRGRLLAFSAIQSPAGRNAVSVRGEATTSRETAIVLTHSGVLRRSDAVLHLLAFMPAPWPRIERALRCVPHAVREGLYFCIDTGRRHLIGRRAECMLAIPGIARRFVR